MDNFLSIAKELETIGLRWVPEVGDEVSLRALKDAKVSILVDADGMSLYELRENYIWLPTIEQLLAEIENRGGLIFHAGFTLSKDKQKYEVVIQTIQEMIKVSHNTLREALALALKKMILQGINSKKIS